MSGLFANLNTGANNSSSGGGLFGNSTANTNPSTSGGGGLFGGNAPSSTNTGGLFGGNAPASGANPNPTSGFFSNASANTTANPTTSSLFSNLNTSTNTPQPQPTSGGLFGGLGASTSGAGGGGSFAGAGQSTQALPASSSGGGLFGNRLNIPASSAPGGSVFGNNTGGSGNLFGGANTQAQSTQQNAAPTNLSASTLAQPSGQTSFFDSILQDSKTRKRTSDDINEDLPQLQLGLGDLRQRIKRLGTGADKTVDSRAHYLLAASGVDPGAAIRDLKNFSTTTGTRERAQRDDDPETDVESYLANLQTQTTLSMIQDGLARSVRDFDAFLEENVSMEWDAQRKRIYQHFGIKPKENVPGARGSFAASAAESKGTGFGRSRRSKAAALAGSRTSAIAGESTFGRSSLQRSVIGAAGPVGAGHQALFADVEKNMEANGINPAGPHDRFQREKQNKFAQKVQGLNLARLQQRPFPIAAEFQAVVDDSADQHGPDLIKAYQALAAIVGENSEVESFGDRRAVQQRQYASAYLAEGANQDSVELRKKIIRGGARCLENLALKKMEDLVAKNSREAAPGGSPDVLSKIKAYVRLEASRKNLAGDNTDLQVLGEDYVWALIYFLIRTGHITEANEYVAANAVAFRAIDRNFGSYIRAYASSDERKLPADAQTRISNEYNQRIRIAPEDSIDPYRMACYKIIGRCDLRHRSLDRIKQDIEDFAWVQLVLARETSRVETAAHEVYGLAEAQTTIKEIGDRYFAKGGADIGSSFGAFVFLQVVVGMFEQAASYLYTYSYVDAVHFALALDYYGLLRVSDPNAGIEDLLSLTTRGQPQINFGSMLGLYTRDFRTANVSAAVDYLTLICLNQDLPGQLGKNQVVLCHEALRELVLESREFSLLLGDIRDDGQRLKGLIEERSALIGLSATDDFMRTITLQAASIADDNGRTTDAVLLYQLAGEYDNVVLTINRSLSESIARPIGEDPMRLTPLKPRAVNDSSNGTSFSLAAIDDPYVLAGTMREIHRRNKMFTDRIKQDTAAARDVLMALSEAKYYLQDEQWVKCLDVSSLPFLFLLQTNTFSLAHRQHRHPPYRALGNAIARPQPRDKLPLAAARRVFIDAPSHHVVYRLRQRTAASHAGSRVWRQRRHAREDARGFQEDEFGSDEFCGHVEVSIPWGGV